MPRFVLVLVLLTSGAALAADDVKLPSWIPAQDQFSLNASGEYETFGEGKFTKGPANTWGDDFNERGHHWHARLWPASPKPWSDGAWNGEKVFTALVAGLQAEGFTADYDRSEGRTASFHKGEGNGARYVWFRISKDDPHGNDLDAVEVAPLTTTLTLPPPSATRETVGDHEELPYLKGLPGWRMVGTDHSDSPMDVYPTQDGDSISVRGGNITKNYRNEQNLSNIEFENVYAAALSKAGWTLGRHDEHQGYLYAHYDKNGRDLWAYLTHGEHVAFRVGETAQALAVTLTPPGRTPETITDSDDIPYLTPLPEWKKAGAQHGDDPLSVFPTQDGDAQLVGSGTIRRAYRPAGDVSNVALERGYEAALKKAGWTIGRKNESQGFLYAHYAQNGRDIWAHVSNGEKVAFEVTDVGGGLKAALQHGCKVAVYGVNFDFNKSSLRPDSNAVLAQMLQLFHDDPALALEIGGHTDNVGSRPYNLKLSSARAGAVKAWLVKHGVAAKRISIRGYGDTVPLVPNDSDVHRAKNRRVELKKPSCP